uniref:MlaA family lipoprotein n=1 Tax=Pseudomonas sp. TaxID=306 RepID=UPI0025878F2E
MRLIGAGMIDRLARACLFAGVVLAPGVQAADEDPWEGVNRVIFRFNDTVDTYAFKPIAQGYQFITPQFMQDGVHNFFQNIGDVGNLANDGDLWHSHWVVLKPDDACGKGALKVVDIPEGAKPKLPKTWPNLPLLIEALLREAG